MNFYVVCDLRDDFDGMNVGCGEVYNDHPGRYHLDDFINVVQTCGYMCSYFGGIPQLVEAVYKARKFNDIVFLNLSDGLSQAYARVQAPVLYEILGCPYSGSDVFSSALVNNKFCSTRLIRGEGFAAPKGFHVGSDNDIPPDSVIGRLLPVFIKPNTEGSSMGITRESMQTTIEGARNHIMALRKNFDDVLVETFIGGVDVTVFVIGNSHDFFCVEPLAFEIEDADFLDINVKANRKSRRVPVSDLLPQRLCEELKETAMRQFKILGCRDIARFDYRVDKEGAIFFIEANSAPRLSRTSELGALSEISGIAYEDYIAMFVRTVLNRIGRRISRDATL